MERNLLLKIQYDGSAYHGWQVQENARSVQGVFQEALKQVLHTQPDIKACSRTDTGVHAREFCLSMKLSHNIPPERLLGALNHFLPPDIAVLSCEEVPLDFHARYSCCGKRYVYEIWNNPIRSPFLHGRALHYYHHIDEKKLNEAAQHFLGAHDFTSFCTLDNRDMGDFTRTVTESFVTREVSKYPLLVRDINGDDMYMLTNTNCAYRSDGTRLPYGSGKISGVIVHERFSRFEWRDGADPAEMDDDPTLGFIGPYLPGS